MALFKFTCIAFSIILFNTSVYADSRQIPNSINQSIVKWFKNKHPNVNIIHKYVFWKPNYGNVIAFFDFQNDLHGTAIDRDGGLFQVDSKNGNYVFTLPETVYGTITGGTIVLAGRDAWANISTVVLKPNDPRCCPTGHKVWRIGLP